jgi:hypothetical protein
VGLVDASAVVMTESLGSAGRPQRVVAHNRIDCRLSVAMNPLSSLLAAPEIDLTLASISRV